MAFLNKEVKFLVKTNAMRLLEQANINFYTKEYECNEDNLLGINVAKILGIPPEQVFKTLVTKGEKKGILVFCIPVNSELDLKKAAKIVGDKKIEMLHVKDLLKNTGYIRGGCSPIGMKKKYPTYIDETAILFDKISISSGIKGCQIILNPKDLIKYINAIKCDLICI